MGHPQSVAHNPTAYNNCKIRWVLQGQLSDVDSNNDGVAFKDPDPLGVNSPDKS